MSAVVEVTTSVLEIGGTIDLERSTMRRVTRRILPLVFALYVAAFLDRVNIAIASLRMNQDVGLSATAFGLGSGIFFLGYALFEVPSNVLLARVGARWWIARIAITWGVLACAMALVQGPKSFFALRLSLGFAEAGFAPGVFYYFTHWFPERRRARATSLFMVAIPISGMIGGPLGGALLGLDGRLGLAGWQWLFFVEGVPSVLLGLMVLRWLPDRPADAAWLPADERVWLEREIARGNGPRGHGDESVWAGMSNAAVWWLCAPYLLYIICGYAIVIWTPQLIRSVLHVSDQRVGLITGGIGLLGAAAMLVSGAASDRRNERVVQAGTLTVGIALGLSVVALGGPPLVTVAALAFATACSNSFLPPFWSIPPRILGGVGAAAGIALINSIGNIGGFIGPYMVGALKTLTGGFTGAFAVLAGIAFVASALMLSLSRLPALQGPASGAAGRRVAK